MYMWKYLFEWISHTFLNIQENYNIIYWSGLDIFLHVKVALYWVSYALRGILITKIFRLIMTSQIHHGVSPFKLWNVYRFHYAYMSLSFCLCMYRLVPCKRFITLLHHLKPLRYIMSKVYSVLFLLFLFRKKYSKKKHNA